MSIGFFFFLGGAGVGCEWMIFVMFRTQRAMHTPNQLKENTLEKGL